VSAGHDALTFFELLYGEQPPGQILICETDGNRWTTHACLRPTDAVQCVLGHVDVFHRVGLVDHKPPTGKRGDESFTTALTTIWHDIDVNGSPDGRGGLVKDAAPSLEAALELHHSVLQPSFLVGSGYGLHGYLKLAEPWLLRNEEDRERARRLVRGWHERIKQEAVSRGMAKLDSVFDLARVLRPVGSLNGKAQPPVPVELLDDGGPVYTIEQIAAEIVDVAEPDSTSNGGDNDTEPGRPVETLLEEFEQLGRIVRRDGKAPGDGSGHSWDFYLCCEGVRCGCTDPELTALIVHNRTVNPDSQGKRNRPDYAARTIAKAHAAVTTEERNPAKRISARWNLDKDPIASGKMRDPIVYLTLRSGRVLRLPSIDDLFEPNKHTRIVSRIAKTRFPRLSPTEAVDIAQRVIELCPAEALDPLEEARWWVVEFIAHAGATIDAATADGTPKSQWQVLNELAETETRLERERYGIAERAAIIVKGEELWLPAKALKAYSDARVPWPEFTACLAEIGWRRVEIDIREPTTRAGKSDARRAHRNFYVGTD
jgi:hypothetical protein